MFEQAAYQYYGIESFGRFVFHITSELFTVYQTRRFFIIRSNK